MSARLGWVEREFSDATTLTSGDGAFLGSDALAAAVESCVNGWSRRRAALVAQLAGVARLSALAADSYERTDAQLAAALDKAVNGGAGG